MTYDEAEHVRELEDKVFEQSQTIEFLQDKLNERETEYHATISKNKFCVIVLCGKCGCGIALSQTIDEAKQLLQFQEYCGYCGRKFVVNWDEI